MPTIIKTIDEIMSEQQKDIFVIDFNRRLGRRNGKDNPSRQRHLEWFEAKGLRYEMAAPCGWLEGDPGMFVVYFDSQEDLRVAEYSDVFETPKGGSLVPDEYQMFLMSYETWRNRS